MKLKELYELVYYTGEFERFVEFVGFDNFTHFTDGPAYIEDTGYKEWWIEGIRIKDNYKEIYPR